jgi:small subunit ribosomal protein S6
MAKEEVYTKEYEIMSIASVDLGDSGAKDFSKKVVDLINSLEGKVLKNDYWGKRKFAYEIKHKNEGYYDVTTFEMPVSNLKKFKTKLNLLSGLVRYLITAQS